MKKYLLLALLTFVPFFASAQEAPGLYVSDLLIEKTNYQIGENVTGSFDIFNSSESDASDLYYSLSLVNESSVTGIGSSEIEGPFFVHASTSAPVNFVYKINEKIEDSNQLQVSLHKNNGAVVATGKINITISGDNLNFAEYKLKVPSLVDAYETEIPTIEEIESREVGEMSFDELEKEIFMIQQFQDGDTDFTLNDVPYVEKDEELLLIVDEEIEEVEITIYRKNFNGENVYSSVPTPEDNDGEKNITIPTNFTAGYYVGEIKVDGYVTSRFSYNILGTQADIFSLTSDSLSPKKGESFNVNLVLGGWPVDVIGSEVNSQPEYVDIDLLVTNQKGEVVDQYSQTVMVPEVIEENGQTSNIFNLPINLKAKSSAESLTFDLFVYDSDTGQILDSLQTTFGSEINEESPSLKVLIVSLIILIALSAIIFAFKLGKKIPTVVLVLLFALTVFGSFSTEKTEASWWTAIIDSHNAYYKGAPSVRALWVQNGYLNIDTPKLYSVKKYQPNESFTYDATYSIIAGTSNGYLGYMIGTPSEADWHTYTSLESAKAGIQYYLDNYSLPYWAINWYGQCLDGNAVSCNFLDGYSNLYGIDIDARLAASTFTEEFSGYSFSKSYSYSHNMTMPSTPGDYYIPLHITYCTASHGCADKTYIQRVEVTEDTGSFLGAPIIEGPSTGKIDEVLNFTAVTYSEVASNGSFIKKALAQGAGDQVRYGIDWDNNDSIDEWAPSTGYENIGIKVPFSNSWDTTGSYTFKVLAENQAGLQSAWTTKNILIGEYDTCSDFPGERECISNTWHEWVCTSDGWELSNTGEVCTVADDYTLSCSYSPSSSVAEGGSVTVEASIYKNNTLQEDVDFDFIWKLNGNIVNSNNKSVTFDNLDNGFYNLFLELEDLNEGKKVENFLEACPFSIGSSIEVPEISSFKITPNFAPNCKASFVATNVTTCSIIDVDGATVGEPISDIDDGDTDSTINATNRPVEKVGTFRVRCEGSNTKTVFSENTQKCSSVGDFIQT